MSFLQRFLDTVREKDLFPPQARRVLAACSGGMDSVFLLHLLWAAREKLDLELCAVTCDHGLRPESGADAEWVRQLSWSLGIPCHFLSLDVSGHTRKGESTEMAARRLRLEGFAGLVRETGADAVALGHHRDDQAETVLMRLCRGTGTRGAAGMNWVSEWEGMRLVRPLLGFSRGEIAEAMRRWGRGWREDGSNADPRFLRNRVRHEVLPLLEQRVNPAARAHLAAFAEQQRELETWAASRTRAEYAACVREDGLDLSRWRKRPHVLRQRILLVFLRQSGAGSEQLTAKRLRRFHAALLEDVTEGRVWPFRGCTLLQENGILLPEGKPAGGVETHLPIPGEIVWEPLGRILSAALRVRSSRTGDRYRPMGMRGRAKLSDLFINAKVPKRLRGNWPVVTAGEEIVWVPGFRVAEECRVTRFPCVQLTLGNGTVRPS